MLAAIIVCILFKFDTVIADPGATQLPSTLQSTHQSTISIEIDNSRYGPIQFFAGSSKTGIIIGRVLKPATQLTKSSFKKNMPQVVINTGKVVVISPSRNEEFRIVSNPEKPVLNAPSFTMITDLQGGKSIFNPAIDPVGTSVKIHEFHNMTLLPSNYTPSKGDHIYLIATLTANEESVAEDQLISLAKEYSANCLQRAHFWHRTIVTGTLKASAILPTGEPDPIAAVEFSVDGNIEDLKNTSPYLFIWDSRKASNGEHILEIDALDQDGNIITSKRMLVVVENGEIPHPIHTSRVLKHVTSSKTTERKQAN